MIEEILASFLADGEKYIRRGMPDLARECCKGIIIGLWRIRNDPAATMSDEIGELIPDCTREVLEIWGNEVGDPAQVQLLLEWMKEEGIPT